MVKRTCAIAELRTHTGNIQEFFLLQLLPLHITQDQNGDDINDPGTVLEPPTKCLQSQAIPGRLGLQYIFG